MLTFYYHQVKPAYHTMSSSPSPSTSVESFGADLTQQPALAGHRGNLTPQQNAVLLRLWYRFLHLCNTVPDPNMDPDAPPPPTAFPYIPDNEPRRHHLDDDDAPVQVSDTEPGDSPANPNRMLDHSNPSAPAPPRQSTSQDTGPLDGRLYTHAHHQFTSTEDWDPNGPMNHRNAYMVDSREGSIMSSVAPSGEKLPGVLGAPLQHAQAQASTANLHQFGHTGQLSAAAAAHLKAQKRQQQRAATAAAANASKRPTRPHLPGSHIPRDDRVKDELRGLEEAKEMKRFLETYGGAKLKQVFWQMCKGEHPDAVLLRILRARKWNVDRALNVLGSTAYFRVTNRVAELVKEGELGLIKTKGGAKVLRNGISYVRGATKTGEPVYFIDVGSHFSSNQTQEELKRYIIISHETVMQLVAAPTERCVVVFNMNRFGLRNMDWWCVFFLVKTVEAYYPESLMRVYVHAYPFIFRPIWYILRPLLDPVVRDKVRLTTHVEELEELIPRHHLPKKAMHGDLDWDFEYPEPDEHENDLQLDVARTAELQAAYDSLAIEFERATSMLIEMSVRARLRRRGGEGRGVAYGRVAHEAGLAGDYSYGGWGERKGDAGSMYEDSIVDLDTRSLYSEWKGKGGSASLLPGLGPNGLPEALPSSIATLRAQRDVLATRLRVAWLELRPYVTGVSKYDRWGVTSREGTIHWEYVDTAGRHEEQVLGEGIALSALKRGLSLIEEAKEAGREKERERGRGSRVNETSGAAGLPYGNMSSPPMNGARALHPSQPPQGGHQSNPSTMQSRKERQRSRLQNVVAAAAASTTTSNGKAPRGAAVARDESPGEIEDEEVEEEMVDDAGSDEESLSSEEEGEEDDRDSDAGPMASTSNKVNGNGDHGWRSAQDELEPLPTKSAPVPIATTAATAPGPTAHKVPQSSTSALSWSPPVSPSAIPTSNPPTPGVGAVSSTASPDLSKSVAVSTRTPQSPTSPKSNGAEGSASPPSAAGRSVSPEEYEAARSRLRAAADKAIRRASLGGAGGAAGAGAGIGYGNGNANGNASDTGAASMSPAQQVREDWSPSTSPKTSSGAAAAAAHHATFPRPGKAGAQQQHPQSLEGVWTASTDESRRGRSTRGSGMSPPSSSADESGAYEGAERLRKGGQGFNLEAAFAASTDLSSHAPGASQAPSSLAAAAPLHSRSRTEGTVSTIGSSVSVPIHPMLQKKAAAAAVTGASTNGAGNGANGNGTAH